VIGPPPEDAGGGWRTILEMSVASNQRGYVGLWVLLLLGIPVLLVFGFASPPIAVAPGRWVVLAIAGIAAGIGLAVEAGRDRLEFAKFVAVLSGMHLFAALVLMREPSSRIAVGAVAAVLLFASLMRYRRLARLGTEGPLRGEYLGLVVYEAAGVQFVAFAGLAPASQGESPSLVLHNLVDRPRRVDVWVHPVGTGVVEFSATRIELAPGEQRRLDVPARWLGRHPNIVEVRAGVHVHGWRGRRQPVRHGKAYSAAISRGVSALSFIAVDADQGGVPVRLRPPL